MGKIGKVDLKNYVISPAGLDNLASEFYGRVLTPDIDADNEIEVEFQENEHFIAFYKTLGCYLNNNKL